MIIGIIGKKRSGKDTIADYLVHNYDFEKYSFGEPIKLISQMIFDLSDEQINEDVKDNMDPKLGVSPRKIFQVIGTEIFQNKIYEFLPELEKHIPKKQFWTHKFESWYQNNKNNNIVIPDVRFIHEYECLNKLNAKFIKISRNNLLEDSHISENQLHQIPNNIVDYQIENNNNINDLYLKVDVIFKDLYVS